MKSTVKYQIGTYSGEVQVYDVDPNDESEYVISRARNILKAKSGELPYGSENWKEISREEE